MIVSTEKVVKTLTGVDIWTESFGNPSNPCILLIMGTTTQGIFWHKDFCSALVNAGFFVIRYDNRDTGQSTVIDYAVTPYDLIDMMNDAIAVLDAYHLAKASIMGVSMGGYIAQFMAIYSPARVDKLILLSTSADQRPYMYSFRGTYMRQFLLSPPTDALLWHFTQAAFYTPKTPEAVVETNVGHWRAVHSGSLPFPEQEITALVNESMARMQKVQKMQRIPRSIVARNHGAAIDNSPDRLESVKKIKAKTLVLHGEFDPCLPLDHGEYLKNNIANAQLVKLDMGHLFPPSMSQEMAEYVINFINS